MHATPHPTRPANVPPERVLDFARATSAHVTFGNGPHLCPGAHLARTALHVTIEEWLAPIPGFMVAPGAERRFRGGLVGVVDGLPLVRNPLPDVHRR